MTDDQTPREDRRGMPGDDSRQQPGPDDASLQELSDVYAELINDPSAPPRPAREAVQQQALDNPAPIDSQEVSPISILEALLFVGHPENKPLLPRDVAAVIRGLSTEDVVQLVLELNDRYQNASTPYEIIGSETGYVMQLREEAQFLREKFYNKIKERRLSQAAIDVLAIVAYNQGITRDVVNELRDRSSGAILSQLVRRKILRIEQQDEQPRKPRYYTGDRFLELFGLLSIEDLPQTYDLETSA